jgi:hypothetical protein
MLYIGPFGKGRTANKKNGILWRRIQFILLFKLLNILKKGWRLLGAGGK